jgi:hypothetical protein
MSYSPYGARRGSSWRRIAPYGEKTRAFQALFPVQEYRGWRILSEHIGEPFPVPLRGCGSATAKAIHRFLIFEK